MHAKRTPGEHNLAAVQRAFAAHIRDSEHHPAPAGVPARRMALYRTLFFANIEGVLGDAFPVLAEVLGAGRWERLVQAFFAGHACRTPIFSEVPAEFLDYLESGHARRPDEPPYLTELARYEWTELALTIAPTPEPPAGLDPEGDLLAEAPVLSPLAECRTYAWPVHRITAADADPDPETTHLLVYRAPDETVEFLELNPVSARLLELLGKAPGQSGCVLLEQIANELHHPQPETVIRGGHALLYELCERGVLLGTTPTTGGES
jgi:hypothetical protein